MRNTAMSRRKAEERWARSFSLVHIAPGDVRRTLDPGLTDLVLAAELEGVRGRVQFRFRFEGTQRNPSVSLKDGYDEVLERRSQLIQAAAEDWDLGDRWPVPPGTATVHALRPRKGPAPAERTDPGDGDDTATGEVLALFNGRATAAPDTTPAPAPVPETPVPGSGPGSRAGVLGEGPARYEGLGDTPDRLACFRDLAGWVTAELGKTTAKSEPTKRAAATLGNIDSHLAFADTYFRSGAETVGSPGTSLPFWGPDGIDQDDCFDFLDFRKHANLRTRAANQRAVERWVTDVERAAEAGTAMPPPPEPEVEIVKASTILAAAKTLRRAFENAFLAQLIDVQPWTARVDERVEGTPLTDHCQKPLPDPDALAKVSTVTGAFERRSVVGGKALTVTGERYVMYGEFTEKFHLRPEEARAVRLSSLRDSDLLGRHLVVSESIVFVSARFTDDNSSRQTQGLKARPVGDTRTLYVTVDDAFWARLDEHIERFVPVPDRTSPNRDVADPLLFTTHNGSVIAPGPFNENWWRPVIAIAAETAPVLEGFQFRQLHHTGITRRLLAGDNNRRSGLARHGRTVQWTPRPSRRFERAQCRLVRRPSSELDDRSGFGRPPQSRPSRGLPALLPARRRDGGPVRSACSRPTHQAGQRRRLRPFVVPARRRRHEAIPRT